MGIADNARRIGPAVQGEVPPEICKYVRMQAASSLNPLQAELRIHTCTKMPRADLAHPELAQPLAAGFAAVSKK